MARLFLLSNSSHFFCVCWIFRHFFFCCRIFVILMRFLLSNVSSFFSFLLSNFCVFRRQFFYHFFLFCTVEFFDMFLWRFRYCFPVLSRKKFVNFCGVFDIFCSFFCFCFSPFFLFWIFRNFIFKNSKLFDRFFVCWIFCPVFFVCWIFAAFFGGFFFSSLFSPPYFLFCQFWRIFYPFWKNDPYRLS